MNFSKRIAKLEQRMIPKHPPRVVMRYEGPGSERLPQPTQEEINQASLVFNVRLVPAKDECPMEPNAAGSPEQVQMSSDVLR